MAFEGNVEIQQLLNADAEAEKIVKAAREGRVRRIKEAISEAGKVVDQFRVEQAQQFEVYKEEHKGQSGTEHQQISADTDSEIKIIEESVAKHRGQVMDLLVKTVSNVDLTLTEN